jgi:hemerythrin-like metal-binding protein
MTPWITWKSYYSVGDPSLDNQHKKILALVNEVYEATQRRDDDETVQRVLKELSRYALTHFRYEEQLMRDCGYPHVAEHSALHEEFRQRARAWEAEAGLLTVRDLLLFLKEWWVGHIQSEDKKYMPCFSLAASRR